MVSKNEQSPELLVGKALVEHGQVRQAANKALQHAVKAGNYLLDAKTAVKSAGGKWEDGAEVNIKAIAPSTRALYMSLAARWDELQAVGDVEDMTVTAARNLLTRLRGRKQSSEV